MEQENDNLAQELVASKVTLRTEMDKVSKLDYSDENISLDGSSNFSLKRE